MLSRLLLPLMPPLLQGKTPPKQLLRVGSTLYRQSPAASSKAAPVGSTGGSEVLSAGDVLCALHGDGTTQLPVQQQQQHGNDVAVAPVDTTAEVLWNHTAADHGVSVMQPMPSAVRLGLVSTDTERPQPPSCVADGAVVITIAAAPIASSGSADAVVTVGATTDAGAATAHCVSAHVDAHSTDSPGIQPAEQAAMPASSTSCCDPEDGLCTICYDAAATCVLMDCGHGGYCWRCAHLLFVRPPGECPVCRAPVQQVLELDSAVPIGSTARVKWPGPRSGPPDGSSPAVERPLRPRLLRWLSGL
jgi:Zinc finger, C3HC4 type (RING finger)